MPSHYILLAFMKKHACTLRELHFHFQTVKSMETMQAFRIVVPCPALFPVSVLLLSEEAPRSWVSLQDPHIHTHIHTPASLSLAVTSVVCGHSFGARGEMAGRKERYGIKICYSFLSRIFTELNTHIDTSRYTGASCCVRVL